MTRSKKVKCFVKVIVMRRTEVTQVFSLTDEGEFDKNTRFPNPGLICLSTHWNLLMSQFLCTFNAGSNLPKVDVSRVNTAKVSCKQKHFSVIIPKGRVLRFQRPGFLANPWLSLGKDFSRQLDRQNHIKPKETLRY